MTTEVRVRSFRPEDEASIRRLMAAALDFDRFPGFTAYEVDRGVVSMLGAPIYISRGHKHTA